MINKVSILFVLLVLIGSKVSGLVQYSDSTDRPNTDIDSLLNIWFTQQASPGADTSLIILDSLNESFIPDFSDSVYIQRLASLPAVINPAFNKVVRNYIHLYAHKKRDLMEQILGLSDFYFPLFEQALDANNMPLELKYLPVIESALNPNAVSRVGATGLWQFMYYTGKMYKLEVNSFVDDRRDPIKATYAAVAFLNDLYKIYDDWILVIAAYNCGPANVNKAIRRSGGKRDYWDIYYRLPKETRGYVPAFIAAMYVMNYYQEHQLVPQKNNLPITTDTIHIHDKLHLQQVAEVLNIPIEDLRNLNPQYRRDIIPAEGTSYVLRLPYTDVNSFIDLQDSIFNYKDSVFFDPEKLMKAPVNSTYIPEAPTKNHKKLAYTVKSGDNLGFIAQWYGVTSRNIMYWNNLRNNKIRSGQKLTIYVHKDYATKYEKVNTMSFEQKQALVGKQIQSANSGSSQNLTEGEYFYHVVRRGDTLWDIAKLYPGVTDTDIMQWNGIDSASKITVGQKLKIKKG